MSAGLELSQDDVGLVLVDAQVRLAAAMPKEPLDRSLRNWLTLLEAAARFRLPLALSEQYPKGLGPTLPVLREAAAKVTPPAIWVEKLDFSLAEVPLFQQFLVGSRRTFVVCGMECHVCVYQTVRALVGKGFCVHVPADAVLSRQKSNWQAGIDLMASAGAIITSTETVVFDLLKRAGGEDFRALSKLIK